MDDRIAAAPADLARYALAKQGKADPALIFKAVALGRVQRHADPVAQSVGENADGVQPFFDHVARVQRAKPLQRLIDRAGGRDQRLICVRAQGGQSRRVLAVKTGLKLGHLRSEEHTSELQSLMRISYAVFCLKK